MPSPPSRSWVRLSAYELVALYRSVGCPRGSGRWRRSARRRAGTCPREPRRRWGCPSFRSPDTVVTSLGSVIFGRCTASEAVALGEAASPASVSALLRPASTPSAPPAQGVTSEAAVVTSAAATGKDWCFKLCSPCGKDLVNSTDGIGEAPGFASANCPGSGGNSGVWGLPVCVLTMLKRAIATESGMLSSRLSLLSDSVSLPLVRPP
jgi:hypothetical protein